MEAPPSRKKRAKIRDREKLAQKDEEISRLKQELEEERRKSTLRIKEAANNQRLTTADIHHRESKQTELTARDLHHDGINDSDDDTSKLNAARCCESGHTFEEIINGFDNQTDDHVVHTKEDIMLSKLTEQNVELKTRIEHLEHDQDIFKGIMWKLEEQVIQLYKRQFGAGSSQQISTEMGMGENKRTISKGTNTGDDLLKNTQPSSKDMNTDKIMLKDGTKSQNPSTKHASKFKKDLGEFTDSRSIVNALENELDRLKVKEGNSVQISDDDDDDDYKSQQMFGKGLKANNAYFEHAQDYQSCGEECFDYVDNKIVVKIQEIYKEDYEKVKLDAACKEQMWAISKHDLATLYTHLYWLVQRISIMELQHEQMKTVIMLDGREEDEEVEYTKEQEMEYDKVHHACCLDKIERVLEGVLHVFEKELGHHKNVQRYQERSITELHDYLADIRSQIAVQSEFLMDFVKVVAKQQGWLMGQEPDKPEKKAD